MQVQMLSEALVVIVPKTSCQELVDGGALCSHVHVPPYQELHSDRPHRQSSSSNRYNEITFSFHIEPFPIDRLPTRTSLPSKRSTRPSICTPSVPLQTSLSKRNVPIAVVTSHYPHIILPTHGPTGALFSPPLKPADTVTLLSRSHRCFSYV